jgi:hypothetical protein
MPHDSEPILFFGGCTKIRSVDNIVDAARREAMVVFHPVDPTHKLIDFIYKTPKGHFHAFQVTLANKHSADVGHIRELEQMVGGPTKLSLYYVVAESRFPDFVTDPVNPRSPPQGNGAKCRIYHVSVQSPGTPED